MFYKYRQFFIFGLVFFLQACTQLDNFMLGKENLPKPSPLSPIKSNVSMVTKWSIPTNHRNKASTYLKLKPVIRGDMIYTADASGGASAVNKKNGQVIWSTTIKEGIVSGPSVAEGVVALGTNRSSVIILRESDGQELLQLKVSGDALSKPLITHENIIVKTIDGNLYGFSLKTGQSLWETEHGSPSLILKASSSPIIFDKLALVGYSDGKLDAVDIRTGNVVWQRSIAYATGSSDVERLVDIDADPIARGDLIFLASYQGYVGALSLSSGQFSWRKPASIYKNMAIDSNCLYMTDSNDVLWAMDRQTGQVKWKQEDLKARGLTEPTLLGHHLIVGDRTGLLHVLSTQTGKLIGRLQLGGSIDISPAISGNSVYVMTANGKLNRIVVK